MFFKVRQLQQSTGAIIKLPEDSQQTLASEVPVRIFGPFQASQVKSLLFLFEFLNSTSFCVI
jgi:hypothetical protein